MNDAKMKKLFYFSLAILLSIILIWFGSKFLFFTGDAVNSTQLFVFGVALVIGGILMLSLPELSKNWRAGALLVAAGFYFFARASGEIEMPWLARIIGIASWLAAALLLYITWPTRGSQRVKKGEDKSAET